MRVHDCESLLEGKDYAMVSREYVKMADTCFCSCTTGLEERWENEEESLPVFLLSCKRCGRMGERVTANEADCVWVDCPVCNGSGGLEIVFDKNGEFTDEIEDCPLCVGYCHVPLSKQEYIEACQYERQQELLQHRYGTVSPQSIRDFYELAVQS